MGMTVKLRGDAWEALFPHALTLMDEVKTHGGVEPFRDALGRAAPFVLRHADAFLDQIVGRRPILEKQFQQIERRQYARHYDDCVGLASDFFAALADATKSAKR